MGETKIEWADYTFNPWWGCEKVSPGCKHCYAAEMDARFHGGKHWGPGSARLEHGESNWKLPTQWQREAENARAMRTVFCGSMCDILEAGQRQDELRRRVFDMVPSTPNLIWLFLTKRPENWRLFPLAWQSRWPQNAMFGFTAENQGWLEKRFAHWDEFATTTLGLNTFISCEPLLGPLDFHGDSELRFIDWVICGGESGRGARPMHPDWARSLRDQCLSAGVPFFFKQWGSWGPFAQDAIGHRNALVRIGKKKAGRLLDGREWNETPTYWRELEAK